MYIEDIFNQNRQVLDVQEMAYGVEWYIEERLGQKIEVNPYKVFLGSGKNPLLLRLEVKKLHKLFTKALEYYHNDYNCSK